MTQCQTQANGIFVPSLAALLSDEELAELLIMTVSWVRTHAPEIPGFERLGTYYRFRRSSVEHWLGSLERVFDADQVAALLNVPVSWVYANADQVPGVLRLGRYVRFRPAVIRTFLSGPEVVQ